MTRTIALSTRDHLVAVEDLLDGRDPHTLEWRFPLEPDLQAEIRGDDVRFVSGGREAWLLSVPAAPAAWTLEPGWVSPSYGVRRETQVLAMRATVPLPQRFTYLFSLTERSTADRAALATTLLN